MVALAGLVPALLVSVALVAQSRRASRRTPRDQVPFGFGLALAATPLGGPALALGAWPVRPAARADVVTFASPTPTAPVPVSVPGASVPTPVEERACRACGWMLDRPGWVAGRATAAICDCCACEAGVDDVTPDRARAHRRRWIEHGAEWFDPGSRPHDWDLYVHLCERTPL